MTTIVPFAIALPSKQSAWDICHSLSTHAWQVHDQGHVALAADYMRLAISVAEQGGYTEMAKSYTNSLALFTTITKEAA